MPAGQSVRGPGNNTRQATTSDASLLALEAGSGRIIGHFDRNTFFNLNGAGTNINRFDNEQLALNIFEFTSTGFLLLGDVDMNGGVSFGDIAPFIAVLQSGDFLDQADINRDGVVDFSDINFFVALLQAQ